jgi:hypothetical protein
MILLMKEIIIINTDKENIRKVSYIIILDYKIIHITHKKDKRNRFKFISKVLFDLFIRSNLIQILI